MRRVELRVEIGETLLARRRIERGIARRFESRERVVRVVLFVAEPGQREFGAEFANTQFTQPLQVLREIVAARQGRVARCSSTYRSNSATTSATRGRIELRLLLQPCQQIVADAFRTALTESCEEIVEHAAQFAISDDTSLRIETHRTVDVGAAQ